MWVLIWFSSEHQPKCLPQFWCKGELLSSDTGPRSRVRSAAFVNEPGSLNMFRKLHTPCKVNLNAVLVWLCIAWLVDLAGVWSSILCLLTLSGPIIIFTLHHEPAAISTISYEHIKCIIIGMSRHREWGEARVKYGNIKGHSGVVTDFLTTVNRFYCQQTGRFSASLGFFLCIYEVYFFFSAEKLKICCMWCKPIKLGPHLMSDIKFQLRLLCWKSNCVSVINCI